MDDLIQKLKAAGKLKEEKVGFILIEGLLKDALKDIQEAKIIIRLGERGPFLLAYQAMLKAGRSLLFLGASFKTLAEQFETMRRKRNELIYEFGGLLSRAEVEASLKDAEEWILAVVTKVKKKNPQFNLPLE